MNALRIGMRVVGWVLLGFSAGSLPTRDLYLFLIAVFLIGTADLMRE